jgi:hypothetical protein
MNKSKLPCIPCGLIACEHHNEHYDYNCDKDYQEFLDCPIYIEDQNYAQATEFTVTTKIKPTIQETMNIRKIAGHITVQLNVKLKGKFLFNIGIAIVKFGIWIIGCNFQVYQNKEETKEDN